MLKKGSTVLLALLSLFANKVAAEVRVIEEPECCPFCGFYSGASLGESITTGRVNSNRNLTFSIPAAGVGFNGRTFSRNLSKKNAWAGNIFAGYSYVCDPFYWGAELSFKEAKARTRHLETTSFNTNLIGATSLNTSTTTITKVKTGEFSADFRPGFLLGETSMIYGRLGLAFNKFTLRSNAVFSTSNPNVSLPFLLERTRKIAAIRLGGGLEQLLCDNWSLRADYVFTNYRKANVFGSNTGITGVGVGSATATVNQFSAASFRNHSMMLGLSYYW